MARYTEPDAYGTELVIDTDEHGHVDIYIQPAGETWHGTADQVQNVRIKLGTVIGVAQGETPQSEQS